MSGEGEERSGGVGPPDDPGLPLFVYGTLKQGELAHTWIQEFVDTLADDDVEGRLEVRDGLPLLVEDASRVEGQVLHLKPDSAEMAWSKIGEFEPGNHYRWVHVTTGRGVAAWVLLGRCPGRGSVPWEHGRSWSARFDPVFNEALDLVGAMLGADGQDFGNFLDDAQGWTRFFRLSAAYLLLWSVIERYTALRFGPGLEPGQRVRRLGRDPEFQRAARTHVMKKRVVFDSRAPKTKYTLDPENPEKAADYFDQLRSNLSHRGKSAWHDGERLLEGLRELYAIVLDLVPRGQDRA